MGLGSVIRGDRQILNHCSRWNDWSVHLWRTDTQAILSGREVQKYGSMLCTDAMQRCRIVHDSDDLIDDQKRRQQATHRMMLETILLNLVRQNQKMRSEKWFRSQTVSRAALTSLCQKKSCNFLRHIRKLDGDDSTTWKACTNKCLVHFEEQNQGPSTKFFELRPPCRLKCNSIFVGVHGQCRLGSHRTNWNIVRQL